MEPKHSSTEDFSSAKAVLLGALAPGVNGPTWNALKISFLMLGLCLAVMLGLAFSSTDSALVLHVTFLVLITGTLFFLLTRKKKAGHKTSTTDDKRLQRTLKRIRVNAIPAIEEVNIFKETSKHL